MNRTVVISHYNESLHWMNLLNLSGIIYSKGNSIQEKIPNFKIIQAKNFGGNQYDIVNFIYQNYENLPDLMTFLQGNPIDHCEEKIFFSKLKQNYFTCFESYGNDAMGKSSRKSEEIDGGFCELNNSWYVNALNKYLLEKNAQLTCPVDSLNSFMSTIFIDYQDLKWIRFTPGSQYTVDKFRCLRYPKYFWKFLVEFIPKTNVNGGTEAHIVERILWYVFNGIYQVRREDELRFIQQKNALERYMDTRKLKNRIKKRLQIF